MFSSLFRGIRAYPIKNQVSLAVLGGQSFSRKWYAMLRRPSMAAASTSKSRLPRIVLASISSAVLAAAGLLVAGPVVASTPYTPSTLPISAVVGEVAFTPNGSIAYATDDANNVVRVINTSTGALITSINVGTNPAGVVVTPNGALVLVANLSSDSVSVISTATNKVTATIPVGPGPISIAVTPDGSKALVVDLNDDTSDGALSIIDLATDTVAPGIPLGLLPQGIAITPDGSTALVPNAGDPNSLDPGTVSVINIATAQVVGSIGVGVTPDDVAISPDGSTAYVSNFNDGTVSVVNVSGRVTSSTIQVADAPNGIAISPNGSSVYVANGGDEDQNNGSISIIDTTSDVVTSTIPVGGSGTGVAVSPDSSLIYATNVNPIISVINAKTLAWSPHTDRISGLDRYATSVQVAQKAFPGTAPVAFIATGTNFPDALSAAAAAAKLGGPLLLTSPTALPSGVSTELSALQPHTIDIVGGTGAVSQAVESSLSTLAAGWGGVVDRESGADRYATGQTIVSRTFTSATKVYIATGQNYPDALSASAAAGSEGVPVVLVDGTATSLDAATTRLLHTLGATQFLIAGGTGAVSAGIEAELKSLGTVERFAGIDRYSTSELINKNAFPSPSQAYYATGSQFPDALSGAVLAATKHSPLYVVQPTCVPDQTANDLAKAGTSAVSLIGGASAIGDQLLGQANCG
jgi:YVTN family beta-propeller protein